MANHDLEHALEQEDEFASFWAKIIRLAKTYENYVYIGIGVILVIWVAAWGFGQYQESKENEAWTAYEVVLEKVNQIQTDSDEAKAKAAEGLRQVIKSHPNSAAAYQAHLELAAILVIQGAYDTAIGHYTAFMNSLDPENPTHKIIFQALGQCYEGKKDYPTAMEWYSKMAADKDLAETGLWNLARVQVLSGDKAAGKASYEKLLSDFPQSQLASQVQDRLAVMAQ